MWRSTTRKILSLRKATGVEIIISENDQYLINYVTLTAKGNIVIKEREGYALKSLKGLRGKIDPHIPLSLVVNGKGILAKKMLPGDNSTGMQSILPNANPAEFYFENDPNTGLAGIARKETIDVILSALLEEGLSIIDVSLGLMSVKNILPFLKTGSVSKINTSLYEIQLINTQIGSFVRKEAMQGTQEANNEYLVGDQYVSSFHLLPFAAATGVLADDIRSGKVLTEQVLPGARKEYYYYKLFTVSSWAFMASTIMLLLISFCIYNSYYRKNSMITSAQQFASQQNARFISLEREVKRKERFIEKSGWASTSRTSLYADRIAALVPPDMWLTSLQVYPAVTANMAEPGRYFKRDTIILNGTCDDPALLNQFMGSLKLLTDFKEAAIKNYSVRNENEKGVFNMEIVTR